MSFDSLRHGARGSAGSGFGARVPMPLPARMPVTSFEYREMAALPPVNRMRRPVELEPEPPAQAEVQMSEAELQALLANTRAEASSAVEARLAGEQRAAAARDRDLVLAAIERFERESKGYYARVETEVVGLALSIAAKILHREAQVDPMLVAALVQIAVNQLKENTAVQVRVPMRAAVRWRAHFEGVQQRVRITVVEDETLEAGDCVLETELGSANFSLDSQLKEVEQGFFDILAQTPRG
jgi:flagellar assembly protein FliH